MNNRRLPKKRIVLPTKIVRLYQSGLSIRTVAKVVNSHYETVRDRLLSAGVLRTSSESKNLQRMECMQQILRLYAQGLGITPIAKKLGIKLHHVNRCLREAGKLRTRNEGARLAIARRTSSQRSAIAKKAWKTRRATA